MATKIEHAIKAVEVRIADFKNPGGYLDAEWYVKCAAKVDVLEEILSVLQELKNEPFDVVPGRKSVV